jgi:predicted Zn-dependent protease with MMP-like domain
VTDPDFDWSAEAPALGLMQLREDPQYPRIPAARRMELVEAALKDGRSLAERIREMWGDEPAAIAARCEVPVIRSEGDAGFGSVVVFAEYTAPPPSITLYLPAVARLDRVIAERDVEVGRSIGATTAIFLAHELYHHFDCLRGNARLSRRHAVKIFGVGRWHWSSGLSSLPEIAAGAFAQQLLGLPFHPKLLDLLLVEKTKS